MVRRSAYFFGDEDGNYAVSVEVGHPAELEDGNPALDLTVTKGERKIAIHLYLTTALGLADAIHKLRDELAERLKGEAGEVGGYIAQPLASPSHD